MRFLIIIFLMGMTTLMHATNIVKGNIVDPDNESIVGASIFWKNTPKGVISDINGNFEIERSTHRETLIVNYIGFVPYSEKISADRNNLEIKLSGEIELEEVVVTPDQPGTMQLKMTPLNAQRITAHELGRAACCNLAESFDTNASVDVTYSDAATGARLITFRGLSG